MLINKKPLGSLELLCVDTYFKMTLYSFMCTAVESLLILVAVFYNQRIERVRYFSLIGGSCKR